MASDWIKMRVDLARSPEVKGIARRTGLSRFEVVGRLHAVWSWADQHLRNGNAAGVTPADLDDEAELVGFAQAMADEHWLKILSTGLAFPKFDKHNGKPAKVRALTGRRVKRHRDAHSVTPPLIEGEGEGEGDKEHSKRSGDSNIPAPREPEAAEGLKPDARASAIATLLTAAKVEASADEITKLAKLATSAQIERALAESRKPYRKPAPQPLPVGYLAKVLADIVEADAKERAAADARHAETQRLIEEQREATTRVAPKPENFPKVARA